jgi:hypothetical protein
MKMRVLNSLLFCVPCFCCAFSPHFGDFDFDFLKVDTSKSTENICEIYADAFVDSSQKNYFLENCFHEGGEVGFLSILDSTVALYISAINTEKPSFFMTRNQQACVGASLADLETTGIPGTHQFSEVLIFELLRFQELGVVKNNRDSFELQLNETVTKMIEKNDYCVDLEFSDGVIGPGCCSLVESPSAIFKISPAVGNIRIKEISSGKYQIDGIPEGTAYSLFNLNGQLISKGFVGKGVLEVPVKRAILKMNNKWFEL